MLCVKWSGFGKMLQSVTGRSVKKSGHLRMPSLCPCTVYPLCGVYTGRLSTKCTVSADPRKFRDPIGKGRLGFNGTFSQSVDVLWRLAQGVDWIEGLGRVKCVVVVSTRKNRINTCLQQEQKDVEL